ncbi:hypothetical protein QJQ45_013428 [Haematococcus lacustris]|nr:hypothetical protein QJQ45_013428 [Haematococcus lacustris]
MLPLSLDLCPVLPAEFEPPSQAKLDLEQLVAGVKRLVYQTSSSQGKQLAQVVQSMAEWDRLEARSRAQLTQALLQCLGVAGEAENAHQLSMAALSLAVLKRHLPPPAAASAFSAFLHYCASSEAMKKGSWHDWGELLHALGAAGMQCDDSPDLTRLCDQAVQLLPGKLTKKLTRKDISVPVSAIVAVGYRGDTGPLLYAIPTAFNQGRVMETAFITVWTELNKAVAQPYLPGCSKGGKQLLRQFAAKASDGMDDLDAEDVSTLLTAMRQALWPNTDFCRQFIERNARPFRVRWDSSQMAISLCSMAFLGFESSSVRDLAEEVAEEDLTAFSARELTNMLHARSMFLAVSIQQAVLSGQSQLASEPQLDSMAAALWKECSRREALGQQWSRNDQKQLHIARQIKDACTGGQTSLTASPPSPSLQEFVALAISYRTFTHIPLLGWRAAVRQLMHALAHYEAVSSGQLNRMVVVNNYFRYSAGQ